MRCFADAGARAEVNVRVVRPPADVLQGWLMWDSSLAIAPVAGRTSSPSGGEQCQLLHALVEVEARCDALQVSWQGHLLHALVEV